MWTQEEPTKIREKPELAVEIGKASPPVVIESIEEKGTKWFISFGGSNPNDGDAIELSKEHCFWLLDQIMNIDPNLLGNAKEKYTDGQAIKDKKLKFLEELTDLTHKYGLYISNFLNEDGSTKEDMYIEQLESHMKSAGYYLQENDSLVFNWY